MPLLRKQPFVKQKTPSSLKDDDKIFLCKLTGEVFLDYEKFFERIILCNSLVWTCELTGKSGLTYQEAVESEEKASKQVASLPDALQKPILYILSLTHRSRLNDLGDDVYSFVKDRFFIGEIVEVVHSDTKKKCKVIKVISPASSQKQNGKAESCASSTVGDSDSDVVCLDDPPKPPKLTPAVEKPSADPPNPEDFEYVVQEVKKNNIYIIKSDHISRPKSVFTRDKLKLYIKSQCATSTSGIWKVKEKLIKKYKLSETKFTDVFDGPEPVFKVSEAKRKPSGVKSGTFVDLTEEDAAIHRAKKVMKEKKKEFKEAKKKAKEERKKEKKGEKKKEKGEKKKKIKDMVESTKVEPNFDELRKVSFEEKLAMKEKLKAERLAARVAQREEMKKKNEEERQKKKEEKEKEKEKRAEEKKVRDEYLKEWSRPRDDLECDDLQDLPVPTPIKTHIPTELFGDTVMILEYLHCFRELMELDTEMPNGIDIDELGKALLETETNGIYFDLLRLFLLIIFQLQEEEDEEDEEEEQNIDMKDLPEMKDKSFKDLMRAATITSQWPQLHYSTPLKKLPIDSFTMTEVLRLHFLSAGAKGSDYNARFRYQQRGMYTSYDDPGLEFRREEGTVLKVLGEKNVFDLEPASKLKILTALIHQILTFVASRDTVEDNNDKLKQIQGELRQHRTAEHRRDREETTYWYKKKLEERAKEKELVIQRKEELKKAKLEKLAQEESGQTLTENIPEEDKDKEDKPKNEEITENAQEEAKQEPKSSPQSEERHHSARQKERLENKQDAEFFNAPIENIQWEKITPEDRVRVKEKYAKKEVELMDLADQLQHGTAIYPIGRDRTFRRYWMFRSIPGLFVEDQEEDVPSDFFEAVEQTQGKTDFDMPNLPLKTKDITVEEKSTTSDKENESFEHKNSSGPPTPVRLTEENTIENKNIKPILGENGVENDMSAEDKDTDPVIIIEEPVKNEEEHVKNASQLNVLDQISQRNQVCWAYYSPDQVEGLINALNPRGYREGSLKTVLTEQKTHIFQRMEDIPTSCLSLSQEDDEKRKEKNVKYQSVKSRNKTMQGAVKNASAEEFLELNLREMILDFEERICFGSLGGLKVKDRVKWRDAIEAGAYDGQCAELTWSGQTGSPTQVLRKKKTNIRVNGETSDSDDDDDPSPAIRDLAKAVLQLSQGIDSKYLGSPLGEDEETRKQKQKAALEAAFKGLRADMKKGAKGKSADKKDRNADSSSEDEADDETQSETSESQKSSLERWEESLMSATSLSQVFLHLAILETSTIWSKSALHARCRICRRKGDGEKMLLCDGCDRGHHMYCLKPQVKKVPQGDWYCPDCRPKDIPKTPRKRRKSVFEEEESKVEEECVEEVDEEDDSSDDDSSSDDSDDSDSDEDSDDEDTEESADESSPQPTKVKLIKGTKGAAKKPVHKAVQETAKSGGRSRKSQESSCNSSRASSQEREKATSKATTSRRSVETESKTTKRKLELEQEFKNTKKTSRRSLDIPAITGRNKKNVNDKVKVGSRRSLDLASLKRKREEDEQDLPQPKKVTSTSRGGEKIHIMKTCEELLAEVTARNESWPFLKPVTRRDAPDYYDIVKTPMDLSTIKNKVNRFEYKRPIEVLDDIRLVFTNCQQYNMPTAPEFLAAQKLTKYFEKRVKELHLNTLATKESPKKGSSPKGQGSPSSKRPTRRR